jgi:hypothetical protein
MIETSSLRSEQRAAAVALLDFLSDEQVDVLLPLVESPNFGWGFIIQNLSSKIGLHKKPAAMEKMSAIAEDEVRRIQQDLADEK